LPFQIKIANRFKTPKKPHKTIQTVPHHKWVLELDVFATQNRSNRTVNTSLLLENWS